MISAPASCGHGAKDVRPPSGTHGPSRLDPAARSPDGVALDVADSPPLPATHPLARGVVTVRESVGDEAVGDVLAALAHAFETEDESLVPLLFTPDASAIGSRGRTPRSALVDDLRRRMKNLHTSKLRGADLFDEAHVERYEYDELGAPESQPRPEEMGPGDVLVRVPVLVTKVGTDRLFDDVLVLVLHPEESSQPMRRAKLRIRGFGEESGP
ncbi:MAG: hypothetical protein U0169_14135 [Polyangiaceae bacterium]